MSGKMNGNVVVKVLKVLGWTLLAVVIVVSVLLVCAVKFINSKDLSPMVEDIANEYIDGHLKLGNIRLGFRPRFPILGVEIEDLSIVSHAFDSLSAEQRGLLPNYADSLLTLDYLSGAVDIKRLVVDNELALHDVVLRGLGVNLVIAHNGKANYELMKLTADTVESSKGKMPGFRINRFALDQPKEIRFYNAADSTSASVLLLTDAAVDGNQQPTYRLKISGNVTSPKATLLTNLAQIDFGVNGKIYWNPESPGLVAMDEMEIRGAFVKATVSGEMDFKESPVIRKMSIDVSPVAVADLIGLLPDSIRQAHRLISPYFSTDASIEGRVELIEPMNLATDTFPAARLNIVIPSSRVDYGKARLKDIALDMSVTTETNLPDRTVIDLKRFAVSAPGTDLKVSAIVSTPVSDPAFDADVEGKIDFSDLPPIVLDNIPGYLSGVVSADVKAKGCVSMFKPERFHRLVADGSLTAGKIYFLSADTSKMVEVGKARIDFDSDRLVDNLPLLKAKVAVDTATILVSGVDLALGSINLNAGVDSRSHDKGGLTADSTRMMPIAGDLKVGRFNIISLMDSAGARIRDIGGTVRVQGSKSAGNVPELMADLNIGHVSAGSLSDRVLLRDTKVKASLCKMPTADKVSADKSPRKKDSSFKEYSYIKPADVYRYVYNVRSKRKHIRRVYGDVGAADEEVLVWNLTKQFHRFLNQWKLSGTVDTRNARLLTPLFPIRNRISTVALRFNNDTVDIRRISMQAGQSDITLSGLVSNVRRALTSQTDNNLKGNFSLMSDTIDINELSASVFTGASYASDRRHGKARKLSAYDDKALEANVDALSKKGPGRTSPVLIPVNIDARLDVMANHLLYSDLDMRDMGGELLVYDGGVNLHDMKAASDAGDLSISALYSAPKVADMQFGFGMEVKDFNIGKFVKLVPAIDSITPLMHDFSGTIGADIAATCRLDSGMNIDLPSLNAAVRITGDNLAFIDPEKYRTLGKWLGFKDKADNTIHSLNVDMTVENGLMRVYPFAFNIDRYRLGIYGTNDAAMNFDYHLSVLKSPIPFKFGITISGSPKKYKVRFGGARFNEDTAIESVNVVNTARINLLEEIEKVFKRGVRNSRFATLQIARPAYFDKDVDPGLSAADSLRLIQEGLIEPPVSIPAADKEKKPAEPKKKKHKRFLFF